MAKLLGWHPQMEVNARPLGNPGSAPVSYRSNRTNDLVDAALSIEAAVSVQFYLDS